ncbi:MAG: L-threonylcarbamoyladenylate synthase [Acidilobaceae archaeon]|nr:L-threonylcarbamoyladenylate synthase [Acidilobaceae archaeon]MCX8165911.1 L-threonylcarbamoyladenylate synthase [Acidilobaceae archaeon]MDW7974553.1 L-threonylcarbamoyladenylate synthase [Sulfolobales archaeon]
MIKLDPSSFDESQLLPAAEAIKGGGLVAFPTETVYGLGADALNEAAVRKIYAVKGRPPDNPIIVHICETGQLELLSSYVPEKAYRLAERLWPGPLTLLVRKSPRVPYAVTAGQETLAVRMPAHPVALKLIELSAPIAAPSANISGRPSPTRGEHVVKDLSSRVEVIIDAGETLYGVESTIVDLLSEPPVLLRPGAYPVEELEKILGEKIYVPDFARGLAEASRALAPGMKHRHYAPRTPLILVEAREYSQLEAYARTVREEAEKHGRAAILASKETARFYGGLKVIELGSRGDMFSIARALFDALRRVDELGVDVAVAEGFEERGLGLAVMNRLRRAASRRIVI